MKKLIIFFAVMLFGANLINVNFFPQKNKLDILFSLDDKFNGKVIKTSKDTFLITNITSDNVVNKNFDNFFIKNISIKPVNNGVEININANTNYNTSVALTPDGYGLRFRVKNLKVLKVNSIVSHNPEKSLDYFSYILSITILLIIAIVLFVFKKKVVKKLPSSSLNVNVLFQKPLDPKNRVVLLEFNKRKYLVLVGNSNILLDIFDENMVNIKTQNEFETYLGEKIEKLDNFKQYIQNAEKLKEFDEKI